MKNKYDPSKWDAMRYIKWFTEVSNQEFKGKPDAFYKEIKLLGGC